MDINNKENLIEGIGDEVLIVIALLLITFIVFLLWLSKDLHCFPGYFRRLLNQNPIITELNANEIDNNNIDLLDQIYVEDGETEDNNESHLLIIEEEKIDKKDKNTDCVVKNRVEPISGDVIEDNQLNNSNNEDDIPLGFITIKLKYLDDRTIVINVDPQSTVLDFKRNNFQQELSSYKVVRLIYNGRELKEMNGEATLAGYGLTHNSTVHCLVTARRDNNIVNHSSINESLGSSSDINLGNLMFPLFGFMLSLLWYYRLNYKYHFNMMTTFALIGITGMYFVACFINYSSPIVNYRETVRPDNINNNNNIRR